MATIKYNYITLKNFFSIGNDPLTFEYDRHKGLNYIYGYNKDVSNADLKNGAGKSVLACDGLLYVLYGKTSKSVAKENIVNRNTGKGCECTLAFNIGDNEYVISRGQKPVFCKLLINGKDETKSSVSETTKYIEEEILKTPYNIFKSTIVLSTKNSINIFEMSSDKKKEYVENIFDLSLYGDIYSTVNKDILTEEKALAVEQAKYTTIEKNIIDYKKRHDTFDTDISNKLKMLIEEYKELTSELQENIVPVEYDKDEYQNLALSIQSLTNKIGTINDKVSQLHELNRTYRKQVLDNHSVITQYRHVYECLCDTCKPVVDNNINFSKNLEEMTNLENKINHNTDNIDKLNMSVGVIKKQITELKNKQSYITDNINKFKVMESMYNSTKNRIEQIKLQMKEEKNKTSPFIDMISDSEKDFNDLRVSINKRFKNIKILENVKKISSPDGIKKWYISNLISELNNKISKYLKKFGANYSALFDPNFHCNFLTTTGPCEYGNFSNGEQQRITHACTFAFRDLISSQGSVSSSILVVDEILDSALDGFSINAIIDLLSEESKDKTIFLISHREELANSEKIDNVIILEKENGITKIIKDNAVEKA